MMRLFIGLALPDEVKDALYSIVSGMRLRGQPTERENYHLTLAFLGARGEEQVAQLHPIISAAAEECPPLTLAVKGTGFFGRRESALLYAELSYCKPLLSLSDSLRRLLTEAGEAFDGKPFAPHITLARKADLTAAAPGAPMQMVPFTVHKLTLFHSVRIQGDLRYRPVF
ncbi:MAG: RNA 2',3'-cyclic phosphodiesterase [Bacillota bacterium]